MSKSCGRVQLSGVNKRFLNKDKERVIGQVSQILLKKACSNSD